MRRFLGALAILALVAGWGVAAPGAGSRLAQARSTGDVFSKILKANVDADGAVSYDQIRVNKGGDIYEYLAMIEDADLAKMQEKEKAAFWVNAFNAYVIKQILGKPDLQTLSEADAVYEDRVKVANWKLSLNAIKHRVIRSDPDKGGPVADLSLSPSNPLILFGLCDGTVGSPKLRRQPFSAALLDEDLKECALDFINDPKNVSIQDGKLKLSTFFSWYARDFEVLGGVAGVIKTFLSPERTDAMQILTLLSDDVPADTVYSFDWTVNSAALKKP